MSISLSEFTRTSSISNTSGVEKSGKTSFFCVENLYLLLLFLLPIFFLPNTADVFVLNKAYLVMMVASLSLVVFFFSAYRNGSLKLLGIKAYGGMFLLSLGAILSAFFSKNRHISIYGGFGNYNSSLIFMLSLFAIGFVSANSNLRPKKLVEWFVAGVTLSTLISFLAYFGVHLPVLGNVGRTFSLVGSTNTLAGLQVVSLLASLYYLGKSGADKSLVLFALSTAVNGSFLAVSVNLYTVVLIVFGFVYLVTYGKLDLRKNVGRMLPAVLVVAVFSLINYLPATRNALGLSGYQNSVRLPIAESWRVSALAATDFPLTGAGIGMFGRIFSMYRPAGLNLTNLWQIRFGYPFNDTFLWLAEGGVTGLAIYVAFWVFIYKVAKVVFPKGEEESFTVFLVAVVFGNLMLLGNNLVLYVLLFMTLGLLVRQKGGAEINANLKDVPFIFSVLSVAILALLSYHAYGVYAAQVNFAKSFRTNDAVERYNLQRRAMSKDPLESQYRKENVLTSLFIAQRLSQQKDLSDDAKNQINQLVSGAVLDSRRLTEVVDPLNVSNWELRASVYNSLVGVADNADTFAISAYNNAINLDPTNPQLWVNLGSVYYRQKAYQESVQAFSRAVQLKNDFANAHYNLALALKEAGFPADAVTQLQIVQRLIPADSEDAKKLADQLKEFQALAEKQKKEKANSLVTSQGQPTGQSPTKQQAKLTTPEESGQYKIEPNKDISVPPEVLNPSNDAEGVKEVPPTSTSPSQSSPADNVINSEQDQTAK